MSNPMQRSRTNEVKNTEEQAPQTGTNPESVDTLVSGFLDELTSISSGLKEPQQAEVVEIVEEKKAISPVDTVQSTPAAKTEEQGLPEPVFQFEEINEEIDDALSELEQLKSKVIPITDRRDSKPKQAPSLQAEVPSIAATPAAQAKIVSKRPQVNADIDEQAWNRLELFRNQVASRKRYMWLKVVLGTAAVLAILGIPAYNFLKPKLAGIFSSSRSAASASGAAGQASYSNPDVSMNSLRAERIMEVPPVYPRSARKQGISGTVVLEVDVNEKGDVVRAKAISGPSQLWKAAEEALMKWKFKPASANGVSVASKEQISINFGEVR